MDLTKRGCKESKVALITGGNALVALVLCSVGIVNCYGACPNADRRNADL